VPTKAYLTAVLVSAAPTRTDPGRRIIKAGVRDMTGKEYPRDAIVCFLCLSC
jgi:hypothetical protein